ncbi:hypothetical protein HJFPF1_12636 [Paramyrothecium foliicola]|nr:hypothetical protein HJFPF1_12636 [Paramyrothecium foliicola]
MPTSSRIRNPWIDNRAIPDLRVGNAAKRSIFSTAIEPNSAIRCESQLSERKSIHGLLRPCPSPEPGRWVPSNLLDPRQDASRRTEYHALIQAIATTATA